MRDIKFTSLALLVFFLLTGFSLENPQVPVKDILRGGPTKTSIPAILAPVFIAPEEVDYLADEDRVVGMRIGPDVRAYPLKILNYHQVVNDRVGGVLLAVTFCPLTQSVLVFLRSVAGQEITLGVSGRLYKSNLLLYDHQTGSLWSQLLRKAVAGPMAGRRLEIHPVMSMSWRKWKARFPRSQVLADETGFDRDYRLDPYASYYRNGRIWYPVGDIRHDLPPKTLVLGVVSGRHAKAYPLAPLVATARTVGDDLGGHAIKIEVTAEGDVKTVTAADGTPLFNVRVYWFAWQAFYPHTAVHP